MRHGLQFYPLRTGPAAAPASENISQKMGCAWENNILPVPGSMCPGPNNLSLAATGAAFGARGGLRYLSGILTGMILVIGLVSTGLGGLMLTVPGVTPVVAVVAAAYILWLAFRIATAPPLVTNDARDTSAPRSCRGSFFPLSIPKHMR